MTRIKFLINSSGHVEGFTVRGHAGYAAKGEDIVCAGISGGVGLVEQGFVHILGVGGAIHKSRAGALVTCMMPEDLSGSQKDSYFLLTDTFYRYILQLERQYGKYIHVVKRRYYHVEN